MHQDVLFLENNHHYHPIIEYCLNSMPSGWHFKAKTLQSVADSVFSSQLHVWRTHRQGDIWESAADLRELWNELIWNSHVQEEPWVDNFSVSITYLSKHYDGTHHPVPEQECPCGSLWRLPPSAMSRTKLCFFYAPLMTSLHSSSPSKTIHRKVCEKTKRNE